MNLETMDIKEETYKIIGQRLLSSFDSIKLVEWAVRLLEKGTKSESSIILAGMNRNSAKEREKYFWQSVFELQIDIDKTDAELIDYYAEYVAEEVISGNIKAMNGLLLMQNIALWPYYDSKYIQFFELSEAIENIENEGESVYNSGINKDNIDQFVKKKFVLFLENKNEYSMY